MDNLLEICESNNEELDSSISVNNVSSNFSLALIPFPMKEVLKWFFLTLLVCQNPRSVSSEKLIKCGVPQGSILGPLFFLLYINDLPQCLDKTKPRLFADDTNLTVSGDSITDLETAVNSDLEKLRKWLIANKLSLNVAKTEFMLIGSKQMIKNISNLQLNVKIENKSIKQVYESKTLGVTIDQHLYWKTNTENICTKITVFCNLFYLPK